MLLAGATCKVAASKAEAGPGIRAASSAVETPRLRASVVALVLQRVRAWSSPVAAALQEWPASADYRT
jgi:hypothetical protein